MKQFPEKWQASKEWMPTSHKQWNYAIRLFQTMYPYTVECLENSEIKKKFPEHFEHLSRLAMCEILLIAMEGL